MTIFLVIGFLNIGILFPWKGLFDFTKVQEVPFFWEYLESRSKLYHRYFPLLNFAQIFFWGQKEPSSFLWLRWVCSPPIGFLFPPGRAFPIHTPGSLRAYFCLGRFGHGAHRELSSSLKSLSFSLEKIVPPGRELYSSVVNIPKIWVKFPRRHLPHRWLESSPHRWRYSIFG